MRSTWAAPLLLLAAAGCAAPHAGAGRPTTSPAGPAAATAPVARTGLRNALVSRPDFVVYCPAAKSGPDAANQHLLVVPTPPGTFLAFWTQASEENAPDQRIVVARSEDRGRTWSRPMVLAGDPAGRKGHWASWALPFVVPYSGRVYVFWNQYAGVTDAREDTTGALAYRWSYDDGRTWSETRTLPIRKTAISNPAPGSPANWVTYQCPIITPAGDVLVGFTRWASRKVQPEGGLFDRDSEIGFLRFDNILSETDPTKLHVTTLPDGEHGLRVPRPDKPRISVAQEPSIQPLSNNRLICVMRTRAGCIYFALSHDGAHTWDQPRPLRFAPGGEKVPHPLAPCPLYKLHDGRFVLLFFNNDGTANGGKGPTDSRKNRRPAFIAIGREIDDPDQPIAFTPPRQLVDNGGIPDGPSNQTGIATYTSLFEYDGRVYFWYPDRKHYLLGKVLSDELLSDAGLPRQGSHGATRRPG